MRKYLLYIFLFLFAGLLSAQSRYDSAMVFVKNKDFKSAVGIAKELIKADSSDQALKLLVDITSQDTASKEAYLLLGNVYNNMKVYVLALTNYRTAEKLDSTDPGIKFKIANILDEQQQYTDAANKYLQVIATDSTYSKAYLNLGELLYYAKQYPNAAFYLSKYLKFDSKVYKVYLYAANSFYLMQNYPKAADVSTEGLQNFPDKTDLKKIAALSLAEEQKYDDALEAAEHNA